MPRHRRAGQARGRVGEGVLIAPFGARAGAMHCEDVAAAEIARDGADVSPGSPDDLAAYIRAEVVKWAKVVKSAGIVPE